MDFKMNERMRMHCVTYDYQWEIPIDEDEFEPNIPADYTLMGGPEETDGKSSEDKAIEGLRAFAEIANGKYPSSLTLVTAMTEAGKALKNSGRDPNDEEEVNRMMSNMTKIPSTSTFYAGLIREDRDVAYYGDVVTAEDADAVLLRWKVSDNEYRVIFGDLSAGNATAEELAALEQP
jgi:hypothetical protein